MFKFGLFKTCCEELWGSLNNYFRLQLFTLNTFHIKEIRVVVKSFHLCGSEDSKGLSDDINTGTLESTPRAGAARSELHPLQCRGEEGGRREGEQPGAGGG